MLERGDFLESAEVHGNRYGTSQKWIEEARAKGLDIMLEIDWQGAQPGPQGLPRCREHLHSSAASGPARARAPACAGGDRTRRRRSSAGCGTRARKSATSREFDYVIINKEFEEARRDLAAIVRAARLKLSSQIARHPEILKPFS